MTIDALFDKALAEVQAKEKTRSAAKQIAKLRPHAVSPVRKLAKPIVDSAVTFFTTTACACGKVTYSADYNGQLFIRRKLDKNDTQWDYLPARRYPGDIAALPRRAEQRFVSVSHCPCCTNSPIEEEFLIRAFDIHTPAQLSIDFTKWAYPPSLFPLMLAPKVQAGNP